MPYFIGRNREARRAYGFDEISIVPGEFTINPEEVDISASIGNIKLSIPFIGSAMDGVMDPKFAILLSKFGGFGVLNLEGIYFKYPSPYKVIEEIVNSKPEEVTSIIQKIYNEPTKKDLIEKVIKQVKNNKAICTLSATPQKAPEYIHLVQEMGADMFVIQCTILTKKYFINVYRSIDIEKICKNVKIPIILGNCVTYQTSLSLMETGCSGILVGVGPGSACTTRSVLGIGVPQATATIDCAAARDYYFKKTKKYVPIITDGGMITGGDICKAFACGADMVMLGGAFARAKETPAKGYHWGMAMPHQYLPRGTRIYVGITGSLENILFGPAKTDDGTQNLVGALKTCMGNVGARNIKELQMAQLVIAPEVKHEGKLFQKTQRVGMGK